MQTNLTNFKKGDCRELIKSVPDQSIHLILTDPPYFLDGMDENWQAGDKPIPRGVVGSLPAGMKFDPKQGRRLQAFMTAIGREFFRVLKPGAFALVFSQPRLAPRMGVALEDAGFEMRDMYAWRYTRKCQAKAARQEHWIERQADWSRLQKDTAKKKLGGRKTAQLRPNFEAILVAQKPKEGRLFQNYLKHETGLVDIQPADSTVFTVEKEEKNSYNKHLTVKPVVLLRQLVRLFTAEGQHVLDPFLGSGSTGVACILMQRQITGFELRPDYMAIARQRVKKATDEHSKLTML